VAQTPEGFEVWIEPQPLAATLHNSELLWMSACMGGRWEVDASQTAPPGSPTLGHVWIVNAVATGAWTGKATNLAMWDGAQWLFRAPRAGYKAYDIGAASAKSWNGAAWV
jgi:hypothetical protein